MIIDPKSTDHDLGAVSRRTLFRGLAAGAAVAGAGVLGAADAGAKAPLAQGPAAACHRRKIGDIEVTCLLDGYIAFDQPALVSMIAKATPEAAQALSDKAFIPPNSKIALPISAFLVNTGDKLVLIDTGTASNFGPTAGSVPAALAASGVDPASIDVVVLTHAHPDHAGGLVTKDGQAFFKNAELVLSQTEAAFWADPGTRARLPDSFKGMVDVAAAALKPYASRTRLIGNAADVVPGISSYALPGHTPGHTGYRISSGSEQALIIGDATMVAEWLFDKPEWSLAFDFDADTAVATRRKLLDMAAADRMMIAGAHLPFPGFGHVASAGAAYRFVPAPWVVAG